MTDKPEKGKSAKAVKGGNAGRSPWNKSDTKRDGPSGKAPGRGWWNGKGPDKYGKSGP